MQVRGESDLTLCDLCYWNITGVFIFKCSLGALKLGQPSEERPALIPASDLMGCVQLRAGGRTAQ